MAQSAAMTQTRIHLDELGPWVGREVAVSDWLVVSQERIDQFAAAIDDYQWIHVDRERARRESPYQTTIAHGFLTLALVEQLFATAIEIVGRRLGVNYGINRLRFTSPVAAGTRVRGRFVLNALEPIDAGVHTAWQVTVEREEADRPALVAEWLTRHYR